MATKVNGRKIVVAGTTADGNWSLYSVRMGRYAVRSLCREDLAGQRNDLRGTCGRLVAMMPAGRGRTLWGVKLDGGRFGATSISRDALADVARANGIVLVAA